MEDSYLRMLHDDHYSEYNYYGSQVYVPAASPGPSTVQFVHPCANRPNTHPYANHPSTCSSYRADQIESSQDEDSRADESGKRGKGPRKQAAKYDSFEPEERYLMKNFYVIDTLWLINILLFFSAPKIDKLKIWWRQILSRFLVEPNKFCQSSVSGAQYSRRRADRLLCDVTLAVKSRS